MRLSRDCAGLQINDETMARCRSFSLMTEVKLVLLWNIAMLQPSRELVHWYYRSRHHEEER